MDGQEPHTIPTSLRMLAVIEEVARTGRSLTPTEANKRLGLPKPTVHRLFAKLDEEGFLERDLDGKSYTAGWRLRSLAGSVLSSYSLRSSRQMILGDLSTRIGETCNIALPDRDAMIYLERVETDWPLRIQLPQGTRVPLYCTASGKMYLSSLERQQLATYLNTTTLTAHTPNTLLTTESISAEVAQVRKQGYALDREEFMKDMVALAVPIHDQHGRLLATVSFHAPTVRFKADDALNHLEELRTAATRLADLTAAM